MGRTGLFAMMLALALASAEPAVAQQASIPPKYPVESFGKLPFMTAPKLSPDGKAVAVEMAIGGRQLFAFLPLGQADQQPKMMSMPPKTMLNWFRWGNNDRALVSLWAQDSFEGQDIGVSRLISISRTNGQMAKLNWKAGSQYSDDIIYIPKGGGDRILMGSQDTIYSNLEGYWPSALDVDVATGKARTILRGRDGIRDWYADHLGNIRLGFGYDYDRNAGRIIYREGAEGLFKTIDKVDYDNADRGLSIAALAADPNRALVYSNESGREELFDYNLATGKYGGRLWSHPRYDIDGIESDDGILSAVYYTDDRPRVEWFDPLLKQVQADIDKAIQPGTYADIVSKSADRKRLLVRVGNASSPGAFYVYDVDAGRMFLLGRINAELKGVQLAPVKPVAYMARDGLEIPAYLTLPVGRTPRNLPLILLPHGGPAARDLLVYDFWVQFLANRGYAVLQPNYRGSTGYGTAHHEAGEGEWGLKMQDDLTDGLNWLVSQGIADPKRVCIVGGSYGGYAAMQGLVRNPDLYRCAVSFAGVSHMKSLLDYNRNFLSYKRARKQLTRSAPDFAQISPLNNVAAITKPLLLVHGKNDLRVPYNQSRRMYDAMLKAGKPVEFISQPEGDHFLSIESDRIGFLHAMETFLAKHNPAD